MFRLVRVYRFVLPSSGYGRVYIDLKSWSEGLQYVKSNGFPVSSKCPQSFGSLTEHRRRTSLSRHSGANLVTYSVGERGWR